MLSLPSEVAYVGLRTTVAAQRVSPEKPGSVALNRFTQLVQTGQSEGILRGCLRASPYVIPCVRQAEAEVELPDAGTDHTHDGSLDDSSKSPEVALEDSGSVDDDRTLVAVQTLRHAARLQIHRADPAARLIGS
jgi:hypothetical protein